MALRGLFRAKKVSRDVVAAAITTVFDGKSTPLGEGGMRPRRPMRAPSSSSAQIAVP
jgi:hypothetical protein